MTNGQEEAPPGESDADADDADPDAVSGHLESAETSLEADDPTAAIEGAIDALSTAVETAATEADLDEIEETVTQVETAIGETEFPEPDDDAESDPAEELTGALDSVRDQLEDARGPYAEDVLETIEDVSSAIDATRWTEDGEQDVLDAVSSLCETVDEPLGSSFETPDTTTIEASVAALESVIDALEAAELDPDADAATIELLVEAADTLESNVDDAEEWDDLTTREQLRAEGFYDVLEHRKDFPPEYNAIKVWEKRGDAEMVLLALEKLGSEFMEEHCLEALERMGPKAALDPMLERAARRDQPAIRILGKIGSKEALETIEEYAGADADDALRRVALKAVGEIGAREATGTVAQGLAAENESVRSAAARSLGLIGDTRAIEPLSATLAEDASHTVRASAAWALVQIGTERALDAVGGYTTDDSPLVRAEAQRAAQAIDV